MLFLKRLSDLFDQEKEQLEKTLVARGLKPAVTAGQLANRDQYTFYGPPEAHWSALRHLKTNVGTGLNKALEAIEGANHEALQDVLKHINFNRKIGQRTLDDDILSNFVQNFEKIPLRDENFEFPDPVAHAGDEDPRAWRVPPAPKKPTIPCAPSSPQSTPTSRSSTMASGCSSSISAPSSWMPMVRFRGTSCLTSST